MNSLKTIIPLSILCAILIGHSYIESAWTEPVAGPLATTNTPAPLNVGLDPQSKTGALGLNSLVVFGDAEVDGVVKASTSVWSREYCDATGGNCTDVSGVGGGTWGTWTNVTSSRVGRTWYHNNSSTGRAVHYSTSYGAPQVFVSPTGTAADDVIVSSQDGDSGEWGPGFFIVPPGHYYYFGNSTAFRFVSELQLPF